MSSCVPYCDECGAPELPLSVCEACGGRFCEAHRLPESHCCVWRQVSRYHRQHASPAPVVSSSHDKAGRTVSLLLSIAAVTAVLCLLFLVITGTGVISLLFPPEHYSVDVPVTDSMNRLVVLQENRSATDTNWATLTAFLASDDTKYIPYDYPNFTCADFATRLIDDAEAQGIRAGFVFVNVTQSGVDPRWDLGNSSILNAPAQGGNHAIVAFNTTDRGLVFIDDTNTNQERYVTDKVAYLQNGSEYGVLRIDMADNLSYAYYSGIRDQYLDYLQEYDNYTQDTRAFDRTVDLFYAAGFQYNASQLYAALASINQGRTRLNGERSVLLGNKASGWVMYDPIGIVNYYRIFW